MTLFVDTSVWSMALRRDAPPAAPQVAALRRALTEGREVITTGLVLQELLQGFAGPKARAQIIEQFGALPIIAPIATITLTPLSCETAAGAVVFSWEPSMRCWPSCACIMTCRCSRPTRISCARRAMCRSDCGSPAPERHRAAIEARAYAATGICRPSIFSIARRRSRSSRLTSETASPLQPARPVRPMRCT